MTNDERERRIGEAGGAEPLLPVEKKLIAWSLIIGVLLLVFLIWTGNSALIIDR
jgi:hypothetical protein